MWLKFIFKASNKHNKSPIKYLNVLHQNRTQKQLLNYFLIVLQNYCKLPILGPLGMSGNFYQNDKANLQKR